MARDLLQWGLSWLTGQLATAASQTVTYARGPDTAEVRATFGSKLLKLEDGDGGVRMEWTDMDFLIPAADLVLAGEPITPERGDLIFVGGGDGRGISSYEVLPFGSEAAWRWSDPHRSILRVHTKLADIEPYC